MSAEKLQILQMVQEGKITAEEGLKLLDALEPGAEQALRVSKTPAQWLRVRVLDQKTGKSKVNINLPVDLFDIAARFIPAQMHGIDVKELLRAVKEGARGKLIDVVDDEEGMQVEVIVE